MTVTPRWNQLLAERLEESLRILGAVAGVQSLIVGGSVGRGEPWPMSDIDLLPVFASTKEPADEVAEQQSELVDWWAASGLAQTLAVGWLSFTAPELRETMAEGVQGLVGRMSDPRWFHALDMTYGGYPGTPDDKLTEEFVSWATEMRFHPAVTAERVARWRHDARHVADEAVECRDTDPERASRLLREAARRLRCAHVEEWGSGSTPWAGSGPASSALRSGTTPADSPTASRRWPQQTHRRRRNGPGRLPCGSASASTSAWRPGG
ncbi:nucleotidyltransferase family protein [Streptomyces sulphureus]|uniref:nucleotidyltransferase family protein n=1 Tax=Streptomyces sulphureus TaxID=47758 RepID=UPI000376A275|nr:nucleotidyltransferase domain-containing protein [Streptomyces sulphureus]